MRGTVHLIYAVIILYPITLVTVRILGKKQIATMTFWDVVSAITLGSLAGSLASVPDFPLWAMPLGVLSWGALTLLTDWLVLKFRGFRRLVQGRPRILIAHGKVQEAAMRKERMNIDLLRTELRAQGAFTVAEVDWAIIEPNGKVTVQKRAQDQTPTRGDLQLPSIPTGPSVTLVLEGQVAMQTLQALGLERSWLEAELAKQGVTDLRTVFYAERQPDGTLFVDYLQDGRVGLTTLG